MNRSIEIDGKTILSTEELEHHYDAYLNETYPMIEIMNRNYCPAYVFYCTDIDAYSETMRNWALNSGYIEINNSNTNLLWIRKELLAGECSSNSIT